jgi:hypothetical protein
MAAEPTLHTIDEVSMSLGEGDRRDAVMMSNLKPEGLR